MNRTDPALPQADLLRLARQRAAGARPEAIPRSAEQGRAPLSHAQQRMWLMDRLGQGGARYNVPVATRLRGPLDLGALADALTALTGRHPVLRTRYGRLGDEPYQEPLPLAPVPVPVVTAAPDRAAALLRAEAARPFDLATGPVLRALALRHASDDHTVLLTLHHIAVDGGSLPLVAAELATRYAAALDRRPAELPEPPLQYADFARWERSREAGLAAEVDAWADRLAGARPVPLPRRSPAGPRTRAAALHTEPLPAETLAGLRRLGRDHGATLFAVVLAAAFATLHRATGEADLTLGCVSGHRSRPELRRLVGLCVNTLPIRADLAGDPSFAELLGRVGGALLTAQEHHQVPFDLVVERLGAAARDSDGTALLSVTCDVVGRPDPLRLPGLVAEAVEVDLGLAKFDLGLFVEDGPQPRCLVQYDTDALGEPAARQLLAGFGALLRAVAEDGGRRLGQLPGEPFPAEPDRAHPAEAALLADPAVADALVVEREGLPPLAYAVVHGPGAPGGTELRIRLRSGLPSALVPAAVTLLDAMPRLADGGVDRSRLPGAAPETPPANGARVETVRAAFGELLGTRPEPDADFFALGGQSLLALQLAERLRGRTGLPLTGLDILEQRTPRAVAVLLDTREADRRAAALRQPGRPGRGPAREGTVLLTGGTGGVGAALLQELLAQGRPVRALARPESAHLVALDGVEVAEGDLADLDSLRAAVAGVDTVIHAACTFTSPEVDVAAMRTLVDSWRRGSFVFVSSIDAYGRPAGVEVAEGAPAELPVSAYGQGKLDCERILLEAAGTQGRGPASAVRSPIVWGPHRRLRDQLRWGSTGALFQAAQAGQPLVLPDPAAYGDAWYGASWVHSAALARAVLGCADGSGRADGRVVNAVSGHLSWAELAAELAALLGSASTVELRADADPQADAELRRPWRYRADALAALLRPEQGEDWRSVLAAMVG
ncbi:condensation domain-containing protein [Saccharothrix sp. ST-888]|uniref:condensation domain-containing protein n=1 Tax=Saccharothrix sp. ST-888 TaxID=1427391 RepID=UPI0005EC7573|nr:condensation domain-containing protein [Saccharothrix sp. ST-888]KJK59367.1 non-ribosomal peptide synthetase/polyketide synthase [Saccharothrix sp. ST-888]